MAKNPYGKRAQHLNNLNVMAFLAHQAGNISSEQYSDLRGKLYDAQMDNIFAAMAGYCS